MGKSICDVPKTCQVCQKDFLARRDKRDAKFCSRACFFESRKKQVEKVCEECGKTFSVYQARSHARYCSWACHTKKAELTCAYCGETFYVKRSHGDKRRFCSQRCARLLQFEEKGHPQKDRKKDAAEKKRISAGLRRYYAGDPTRHWNYQGGKFTQWRGRHSEWQSLRAHIRQREGYRCAVCGISENQLGKQLSVHHITPFRRFKKAKDGNHPANLIGTCQSCHMKLEHGAEEIPASFLKRVGEAPTQ